MRIRAGVLGVGLLLACLLPASSAATNGANPYVVPGRVGLNCGHEHTSPAKFNPYGPNDGPPPIAIGDSTMLFPIPDLNKVGFDVNAKGCRGFKQAVWVARDMRNRGVLPRLILINSYGNGGVDPGLIKFALKVIGPKRTLALVTAYDADTGHPPAPDTDVIVQAARVHPDQIKLLDWVKYSLPPPQGRSCTGCLVPPGPLPPQHRRLARVRGFPLPGAAGRRTARSGELVRR